MHGRRLQPGGSRWDLWSRPAEQRLPAPPNTVCIPPGRTAAAERETKNKQRSPSAVVTQEMVKSNYNWWNNLIYSKKSWHKRNQQTTVWPEAPGPNRRSTTMLRNYLNYWHLFFRFYTEINTLKKMQIINCRSLSISLTPRCRAVSPWWSAWWMSASLSSSSDTQSKCPPATASNKGVLLENRSDRVRVREGQTTPCTTVGLRRAQNSLSLGIGSVYEVCSVGFIQ